MPKGPASEAGVAAAHACSGEDATSVTWLCPRCNNEWPSQPEEHARCGGKPIPIRETRQARHQRYAVERSVGYLRDRLLNLRHEDLTAFESEVKQQYEETWRTRARSWEVERDELAGSLADAGTPGFWLTRYQSVRLEWRALGAAKELASAGSSASDLKSACEQAPAGERTETPNSALVQLCRWIGIPAAAISGFVKAVESLLPSFLINVGTNLIPFVGVIKGAVTAVLNGASAVTAQLAYGRLSDARAFIRPGTPVTAAAAVLDELVYMRNVLIEETLVSLGQAVASVFDAGVVSGVLASLNALGVSLLKL
jgi:hypothetical protein